ncbi:MAG TPA: type I phosphomannose isomerase catalytic subunit [Planctomycetota bacterium]|nr:type I phosphomannose isomerase catalytic subunit [Planctomycetota bacterium]
MIRADYPLLLDPHLAQRVWAGTSLGKGVGEAWDLSVHPHGPCLVRNGALKGRTLAEVALACAADFGGPLKLLAKRLDCAEELSVQVHPVDMDPKTEAWVALRAKPGAGVYHGFQRDVTADEVRTAARDGSLPKLLRFLPLDPGGAVFVPSGTVHAIGGGLVLFEIQQSADTTYRLFDWGRDRELHLEEGLKCADLRAARPLPEPAQIAEGRTRLVSCEHFHVDRVEAEGSLRVDPMDRWRAVLVVNGNARIGSHEAGPGETMLLPRAIGAMTLYTKGKVTALVYGPGPGG